MAGMLTIEERSDGNVQILGLVGALDGHTFVELERQFERLLGTGQTRIVLDLSNLTYVASAGVGIMVNALRRVREGSGNIVLYKPTDIVRQVMEVLGLGALFTIADDLALAVAKAQE